MPASESFMLERFMSLENLCRNFRVVESRKKRASCQKSEKLPASGQHRGCSSLFLVVSFSSTNRYGNVFHFTD